MVLQRSLLLIAQLAVSSEKNSAFFISNWNEAQKYAFHLMGRTATRRPAHVCRGIQCRCHPASAPRDCSNISCLPQDAAAARRDVTIQRHTDGEAEGRVFSDNLDADNDLAPAERPLSTTFRAAFHRIIRQFGASEFPQSSAQRPK